MNLNEITDFLESYDNWIQIASLSVISLVSKFFVEYEAKKYRIKQEVNKEKVEFESILASNDIKTVRSYYENKFAELPAIDVMSNDILKQRLFQLLERLSELNGE